MICPFLSVERTIREVKYDVHGKIVEAKEIPERELVECRKTDCYLYDEPISNCSLVALAKGSEATSALLESVRQMTDAFGGMKESTEKSVEGQSRMLESLSKAQRESGISALSFVSKLDDNFKEIAQTVSNMSQSIKGLTEKLEGYLSKLESASGESIENLTGKVAEYVGNLTDTADDLAKKLKEGLEFYGGRTIDAAKESTDRLVEKIGTYADKVDDLGKELKTGLDGQKDAIEKETDENGKLLSSISESISRWVDMSGDLFSGLTTGLEEMRAGIEVSANAHLEEQKRTNSLMEALYATLGTLSERMESVSERVAGASSDMREFVQRVKDEREEEKRRQTLDSARAHNDRGVSLYFRKSYAAAVEELGKAIELDPTMAEAHSNMALCLSGLGKDDEAASSFKRALEIDPDLAEAYNNLGLLHFKKKDYEQAVGMFEEAVKKREDYPNAYFNLGSAYRQMDMHGKAIDAWEHALKLDPGNAKAKEALEEISGLG